MAPKGPALQEEPKETYFKLPLRQGPLTQGPSKSFSSLTAYERHSRLIQNYLSFYQSSPSQSSSGSTTKTSRESSLRSLLTTSQDLSELDLLRKHHQFLRDEDSQTHEVPLTWEQRLAKKYYDKLFKEYCLCSLSKYKTFQIAMRWRTAKEVQDGKGQFICGSLDCQSKVDLRSYEVNFAYREKALLQKSSSTTSSSLKEKDYRWVKKNALVKLRLCPECAYKLNYKKILQAQANGESLESILNPSKKNSVQEEFSKKRKSLDDSSDDDVSLNQKQKSSKVSEITNALSSTSEPDEKNHVQDTDDPYKIWSKPLPVSAGDQGQQNEELSRDQEFDQYFSDLFQ